jgi:ribosomal protein L10
MSGVKTQELNELRTKLRPLQARCQIVKNRLAKIALKNKGIDVGFGDYFKGQSALIIQKGDAVAGLKVLVEFEKGPREHEDPRGLHRRKSHEVRGFKSDGVVAAAKSFVVAVRGAAQQPVNEIRGRVAGGFEKLGEACWTKSPRRKRKARKFPSGPLVPRDFVPRGEGARNRAIPGTDVHRDKCVLGQMSLKGTKVPKWDERPQSEEIWRNAQQTM